MFSKHCPTASCARFVSSSKRFFQQKKSENGSYPCRPPCPARAPRRPRTHVSCPRADVAGPTAPCLPYRHWHVRARTQSDASTGNSESICILRQPRPAPPAASEKILLAALVLCTAVPRRLTRGRFLTPFGTSLRGPSAARVRRSGPRGVEQLAARVRQSRWLAEQLQPAALGPLVRYSLLKFPRR